METASETPLVVALLPDRRTTRDGRVNANSNPRCIPTRIAGLKFQRSRRANLRRKRDSPDRGTTSQQHAALSWFAPTQRAETEATDGAGGREYSTTMASQAPGRASHRCSEEASSMSRRPRTGRGGPDPATLAEGTILGWDRRGVGRLRARSESKPSFP